LFLWAHPAELRPADVDCTHMPDEEFEFEVCAALGIFNFCVVENTEAQQDA